MITHLQETQKTHNEVTDSSTIYYIFKVDKLRFVTGVSLSNSQKQNEYAKKQQGTVDLKSTVNQFNIIKIYTILPQ